MKRIICNLAKKVRTLRVNVLTIFLSLFIISFLALALFANSALIRSTENLSIGIIHRLSSYILSRFQMLSASAEETVRLGNYLYWDMGAASYENKQLMALMLNFVKTNNEMTSYLIAQENGNFIAVINLLKSAVKTYQTDSEKPLPEDAAYSIRTIEMTSGGRKDVYHYLNSKFEEIATETVKGSTFDPRESNWYLEAKKEKTLIWTDIYSIPTGETGITVADPVMDAEGRISAVVGADLTLVLLSRFLTTTTVGRTGKAFIVDDYGKILLPPMQPSSNATDTENQVGKAFQTYLKNPKHIDFNISYEGTDYLTHVSGTPSIFGTTHWNIVIMAPFDDFFFEIVAMWKNVFWITLAILVLTTGIIVHFSKRISSPIVVLSKEIDKLRKLQLEQEVRVKSNVSEIILMDTAVAAMRRAIRSFSRYVPKDVVKELFLQGKDIVLGGEKKEITIFFCDVANFTAIAESQPIDSLVPLLEEYFDFMSKIILQSGGTIDKYMGDGIMAFWGAPLAMSDHAIKAATATLRCNRTVAQLNQKRRFEGKPEFPTRFGINLGTVIVGNIGTQERMNYTIIGDAVNTTFRLQDIDKFYRTEVIMSEEVCKKLGEQFVYRPLDLVAVKGKTEKTKIYQLFGFSEGEADLLVTPEQIALCRDFTEAYQAYENHDHARAKVLFSAIAHKFPEDYPTTIYLQRLS